MIDIKSRWKGASDREKWAARGSSFVAKAKATKAVWFPPAPVDTGKKAAAKAKKSTKQSAREGTKKATGATKKAAKGSESATRRLRRRTS